MGDLDRAIAAAREALRDFPRELDELCCFAGELRALVAALDAARGEAVAKVFVPGPLSQEVGMGVYPLPAGRGLPHGTKLYAAPPAALAVPADGPDLEIRNPYRPSESWHIKAAAIGLKVSREALDHTARLLELSDHHLTNGPFPIDRGKTYWRAQAAVAIGGVNELAAKENTND